MPFAPPPPGACCGRAADPFSCIAVYMPSASGGGGRSSLLPMAFTSARYPICGCRTQ